MSTPEELVEVSIWMTMEQGILLSGQVEDLRPKTAADR